MITSTYNNTPIVAITFVACIDATGFSELNFHLLLAGHRIHQDIPFHGPVQIISVFFQGFL